jgi:hypothetical protein
MFKANHFKIIDKKVVKNSINKASTDTNNFENQLVSIYTLRDKIYKIIPQEYFAEKFKIKKEQLCLGRFEIESLNRDVKNKIFIYTHFKS